MSSRSGLSGTTTAPRHRSDGHKHGGDRSRATCQSRSCPRAGGARGVTVPTGARSPARRQRERGACRHEVWRPRMGV